MKVIDNGFETYTIDSDGTKRFATQKNASINGEQLFHFDPITGILELSAESAGIEKIVNALGGYPIAEFVLTLRPIGAHHFQNVNEIKPLPKKDGSFFIEIS